MTLKKDDIVSRVYELAGMSKTESKQAVEALFEIMKEKLERGEDVKISGFGKFSVKDKRERRGRNPQSGEDLMLEPRRVVTFRCSEVFRNKINRGND